MGAPLGWAHEVNHGERLRFSDAEFIVLALGDSTGGAFTIIEEIAPLDTSLHRHEHEDGLFYVLEGKHVFEVGAETFAVGPGATVYAPRGIPHAHRRAKLRTGRFLTMTSPAGFEGFFRELSEAEAAGTIGPDAHASASGRFGISWIG